MTVPRPRFILTCSVFSLLAAAATSSRAQSIDNWTGTTSRDWNTASNWSLGAVPDNTNTTAFPTGGVNAVVNTATGNIATVTTAVPSPGDVVVGNVSGATARLDVTAGSLANTGSGWTYVGIGSSTGTLNVANTATTGGTFTGFGTGSGSYTVGFRMFVGGGQNGPTNAAPNYMGTGTLNINTTGTVTVPNDYYIGGSSGGVGTLNIDAGTLNHTGGWMFVGGDFAAAGGTGSVRQSGGTFNNTGDMFVGRGAGSTGTVNTTGGTFNNTGNLVLGTAGNNGVATVTQSGAGTITTVGGEMQIGNSTGANVYTINAGSVTGTSWIAIGRAGGTGTLNINGGTLTKVATGSGFFDVGAGGGAGPSNGTVNLNAGGTLQVPKIITEQGTSTFNFNGGTLLLNGDGTAAQNGNVNFMQGLTTVNVRAGGALINTAGFNATIAQALLHTTVAGDSAITDGGLTKSGTGILTLAAANTYLGATTITAGGLTVSVNGGLAAGNVSLAAGVTLTLATGVTAAHNGANGTRLTLASATTSLVTLSGTGIQDTVGTLVINGVTQAAGTYGAPGSGATFTGIADFAGGTGQLLVAVPEPSTWAMGLGGIGLATAAWLRRRRLA